MCVFETAVSRRLSRELEGAHGVRLIMVEFPCQALALNRLLHFVGAREESGNRGGRATLIISGVITSKYKFYTGSCDVLHRAAHDVSEQCRRADLG